MLFSLYNQPMVKSNKKKRKEKKVSPNGKPFVSVCTPTYNRRQFIPQRIECYKQQTYPKELMEWIVVDDGEDSVEEILCMKKLKEKYWYTWTMMTIILQIELIMLLIDYGLNQKH